MRWPIGRPSPDDPDRRGEDRGDERRGTAGVLKRIERTLGPGLITGAADDDPSGIATYSQAGAQFQYGLLWTVPLQLPLMAAVQFMCARIGRASGRDLAGVLANHYPRAVLWFAAIVLLVANIVNVAADLQAVAAALSILTHVPTAVYIVPVAAGIVALVVLASYERLRRYMRWSTLALFAYVVAGLLAHPDWGQVLRASVVPEFHFSTGYVQMFVAVFGTTISPYLFFWQSAEEMEEEKAAGRTTVASRRGTSPRVLRLIRADTFFGMFLSQLIGFFVLVCAGAVMFPAGLRNVETAQQAALALKPLGGGAGTVLFCVGLIGTGVLAIPTLAGGASYVLAALFGWRTGIGAKPRRAPKFYISLAGAVAVAAALALGFQLTGVSVVALLVGAAMLNGMLAPPLMIIILLVANNKTIMAGHTNGWLLNGLGILATAIMLASTVVLLFQLAESALGG